MIHHKKRYALFGALAVSAGILGAVIFSQGQSGLESRPSLDEVTVQTAPLHAAPAIRQEAIQNAPETALSAPATGKTKARTEQYLSMQMEGIIGNYAGKQIDNPADNIFTVGIDKQLSDNDNVWLSYELSGVADYIGVPISINDRLATGGYLVKLSENTTLQRQQLDPAWLKKGENRIQFSLPEGADYGYKVSNLSIEIEKVANTSALVVNTTQASYNNKAYLHGFMQQKDIAGATIYVDGKEVNIRNGSFEALVPVSDSRKVTVKAVLANGKEITKEIAFTTGQTADIEYALNTYVEQNEKTFRKGQEDKLQVATALLSVEPGALLSDTKHITITSLRSVDIAALDMGMNNVTAEHKGYRFLPHGEHFADGATVTIKYDRTKIPNGFTEDDIRSYYFDLDTKHWVALERDTIDKKNQLIVSRTTHFTDMINGVIQTPESPETQGFAPTMMNDIKAADPTAKVQLIAPPTANNRGSAGLSYSFEMPPARNGMQPSLGIQYNSDGGSGWLGEGWDLSTASISVDTRWGVPRYNDTEETETYSFNGSMLMTMDDNGESSVAHRGDKIDRKADRQFYPRNEGSFSKIIRKGSSPANYTWEVTDKSGTKYTYDAILKGTAKTLNGDKEVAVEWKLSRVEELHGDWIEYVYETTDEAVKGSLKAKAIYLKEIKAGNRGSDAHTVVTLISSSQKDKKTNSARYGFLTSSNRLLDKVTIAFEGETLRSYTFDYKKGAFNTNILTKINHIDSKGEVFASHDMDYYDDVKSTEGYKPFESQAEEWNLHNDGIDAGFINPVSAMGIDGFSDKASALGGSVTTSTGGSFYAGVGLAADMIGKGSSAGASINYSSTTTKGLSTLVDINGDGLPDKVYVKNGSVYYRPNISQSTDSDTKYGEEIKISGISKISESKGSSTSAGAKAHPGIGALTVVAGKDFDKSTSKTTVYFSDVNNDGLIDLVAGGKVYFNHIEKDANGNLVPKFTLSSGDTPSPLMGGGIIDDSDTEVDPQEQEELVQNSPMLDVVRVWEAPFAGTIKIEGNVQLQAPQAGYDESEYENADGVRVAIQVAGSEKWNKSIAKGDFATYQTNVSSVAVTKGQKVYFRIQSGTDKMSNGAFDQVAWSPVITYTDRTNQINPNGQGTAVYKSTESHVYSEDNSLRLPSPANVQVKGIFEKPVTSDNVTLRVLLSNDEMNDDGSTNPSYTQSVAYTREFAWNETHSGDLSFNITNTINGVNLKFELVSQTNIALENVEWKPVVESNNSGSTYSNQAAVLYSTFVSQITEGQPYNLAANGNLKIEPKFSALTGIANTSINGSLTMAVKSVTGLVAKQNVTITNGIIASSSIVTSAAAQAGTIWVEYYITDKDLISKLGTPSAVVTVNSASTTVVTAMFTTRDYDGFGITNRGWGQFVYNANDGRYGNPISESLLKLPETENDNIDPVSTAFLPMTINRNDNTQIQWVGQNAGAFVAGDIISSARLADQDVILTNPLSGISNSQASGGSCIPGSGAIGISQESYSTSNATMVGAVGLTKSDAKGSNTVKVTTIDINGDGYPDIVTENQIQLTNTRGGFDGEIIKEIEKQKSESESSTISLGGNPVHAYSAVSGAIKKISSKKEDTQQPPTDAGSAKTPSKAKIAIMNAVNNLNISASIPKNTDWTVSSFVDINGDGLPDMLLENGKKVRINLGYGFTDPVDYDITKIQGGTSKSTGVNLGYSFGASSISAGFGVTTTFSTEDYTLMDLNSDGLADKVWEENEKIYVAFNTGNGFENPIVWGSSGSVSETASTAESLNASYTINIPIPFTLIKVTMSPSLNISKSMNRPRMQLRDIDGDGYPEIVSSDEDGKMTVYRSTIARTNKLKSVYNPLGGSFTLDYTRSQATYDHPGGKWVMHSVEVNDGLKDDGANMKSIFDYQDGKQERHEREFLGFGQVITKDIDTEASEENKVYRKAIQQYDVNNVYTAGNQLRAVVEDAAGNKYTESVNEYYTYKVKASADNYTFTADNNFCTDRAIAYTPMKYTKSVVYEGQADGMIANESYYEYYLNGNYGDLKNYKYSDKGTLGSAGTGAYNYQTSVEYTHNTGKHILGLPVKVQVKGSDGKLYRQTEAAYDTNYANHLTKVTQTLNEQGAKAEIDITYDRYGNIKQKTLPANSKGQRMWYKYLYDRDYDMYVEQVEDAFGYRSQLENYDYRYGIPLVSRDMNSYTMETSIDHLGRVLTITAPNEQDEDAPYTIKFEYHPQIVKDANGIKAPAYAVTKHYDPQHPADDLETVTFVDGFGRAIQVKKDGVITETTNGTNPIDKKAMIVSGRAKFDPFGRVREAFYPVSEAIGSKTVFNPAFDAVTPTKTEYDVMDRAVKTILPDNSESLMAYTKDNGSRLLVTTVTDAMGGKQSTFTNGSRLTVKTEQYSGPDGTITTRFEFDPINQLLKAIDNGNNETVSAYDMAGRRTQVVHPASGTTIFKYDNVSNLLSKQTANLAAEGKEITYEYDYSRLTAVNYPDNPQNNVKYYYGNKNAKENRVGRLMLQEDATGAQEFSYDRLGNIEKVRRTVIIPNQAIATYITQWSYDSWNRVTQMVYPDGEKINYSYNTGGLLESVKGEKAYSYNYVNKLGYDKFEQRIYMKYCNGAETNYAYDEQRRRLSNLMVISGKETRSRIMDNAYTYDKVDNVLSVINTAPLPSVAGMGGQMSHTYNYDGLYRLQSATGTYTGADSKSASYSLAMSYDNLHNITGKKQHVQQQGIQFDGILKAGYDLTYNYANNPFQISNLKDDSYRTESDTIANDVIKRDHAYEYDANGNLVYVNTSREKQDGKAEEGANEKKLVWDEENRLQSIYTNGFIAGYWYDANGERVIKTSGDDEGIYVNDVFSGGRTQTADFTAYINPYLVVSKGGQYTKHIYIGSQRIVSKLGDLDSYGQDPRRVEYAGSGINNITVDYKGKYKQSQQAIKDNYDAFEVPYYGTDNDDYVNGGGFCCDDNPILKSFNPSQNDNPELLQYYYHSDHLGSSSLITNLDGEIVQHIEYVPFGEVFLEERNNTWNTPYLFNAKELDEETGLYYYGARYYDPRTSIWLSTDPLAEKYPNKTPYHYCSNNPINLIDPDGQTDYWAVEVNGNKKELKHLGNDGVNNDVNKIAELGKDDVKKLSNSIKNIRNNKASSADQKQVETSFVDLEIQSQEDQATFISTMRTVASRDPKNYKEIGSYMSIIFGEKSAKLQLNGIIRGNSKQVDFRFGGEWGALTDPSGNVITGTVHTHNHDLGLSGTQPDDIKGAGDVQGAKSTGVPWYTVGPKAIHYGHENQYRRFNNGQIKAGTNLLKDSLNKLKE
ncbi:MULTISPECIES: RHS repeat-associated core domain-containing protein [unclassified Dysgonomonas]|uniref:RHS repeat-associated core domain-containing protein n=1 Tax=unclassified Dysgonomonas TaxID=2630389 RepID=UPI002473313A|nr:MULTISPECIES: RHS repeat-associated core domain-containing protein [unclassified Dysgonomonas]